MIKKTKILSFAMILSMVVLELALAQSMAQYPRQKNIFAEMNAGLTSFLRMMAFEVPFIHFTNARFVIISVPLFVLIFTVYALMNLIKALFMMLPKFNDAPRKSLGMVSVAVSIMVLMMTNLPLILGALFKSAIELNYGIFLMIVIVFVVWFTTKGLPKLLGGLLHKGGYM